MGGYQQKTIRSIRLRSIRIYKPAATNDVLDPELYSSAPITLQIYLLPLMFNHPGGMMQYNVSNVCPQLNTAQTKSNLLPAGRSWLIPANDSAFVSCIPPASLFASWCCCYCCKTCPFSLYTNRGDNWINRVTHVCILESYPFNNILHHHFHPAGHPASARRRRGNSFLRDSTIVLPFLVTIFFRFLNGYCLGDTFCQGRCLYPGVVFSRPSLVMISSLTSNSFENAT